MNIFQAFHVSKKYQDQTALESLSINIPEGSVYGLLGPNGAGKTTFLRIVNRITAPDHGSLQFYEKPFRSEDVYQIGYLPEERGLYRKMRVGEHAMYLARLKGLNKKDAYEKLKSWFEKFEIGSWWNKKIEELSKGMQQKVQFIVTVLHEPKLLIFDEPFSGFDPININLLKREILNLKKNGATIIFSTHDMPSVEELCDEITLINKGKPILQGKMTEIKNEHKKNLYELIYVNNNEKLKEELGKKYELLETETQQKTVKAKLKVNNDKEGNELLSFIMKKTHVISYKEILPSMNEIFIHTIEKSNYI